MIEVVIGDVHARAGALRTLLGALGVVNARGRRQAGFWVVQVGDLLDRRADPEANLETARLAASALHVVLAGNHEAALLSDASRADSAGSPNGPALAALAVPGWPQAAAALGDWVVTHAGVHPALARVLPDTAGECAAEINDRWHRRPPTGPGDPLFDWVGPARGGLAPHGGVLWLGAEEWPRTPWGQIIGHAPQSRPRLPPGPRWTIDLRGRDGRLAALVRPHSGAAWRSVVVRAPAGTVDPPAARRQLAGLAA